MVSSQLILPTPLKLRYTSVPQPHKLCTAIPPPKYSAYALPNGNPYPSPARLLPPPAPPEMTSRALLFPLSPPPATLSRISSSLKVVKPYSQSLAWFSGLMPPPRSRIRIVTPGVDLSSGRMLDETDGSVVLDPDAWSMLPWS